MITTVPSSFLARKSMVPAMCRSGSNTMRSTSMSCSLPNLVVPFLSSVATATAAGNMVPSSSSAGSSAVMSDRMAS